ncbi:MAG: FMN-binding negative transcriptional regulator [Burkholderiales bacterium]|nr:FMN-binding negative transcriptional regulator [Burkholderiales bacterium]
MYQPPLFREDDLAIQHDLIRAHPFGALVTLASTGLVANSVPFVLDTTAGERGTLRCHVARANPLWRQPPDGEVLAVFHGPQVYVTPSWYPSKREHGKVVPTWNYAVVHVRGPLVIRDDRDWLLDLVSRLTAGQESPMPQPWAVGDAPADYIERMLEAIVGIEIPVTRIEGKWKVSQNRSEADRTGVAAALVQSDDPRNRAMAALVSGKRPV